MLTIILSVVVIFKWNLVYTSLLLLNSLNSVTVPVKETRILTANIKVLFSLSKLLSVNGYLSSRDGEEFFDILLKGNKFSNSNKHYQQMILCKMSLFHCVSFHL